jgi:hypothetical protein
MYRAAAALFVEIGHRPMATHLTAVVPERGTVFALFAREFGVKGRRLGKAAGSLQ